MTGLAGDRTALGWLSVKGVSDAGDALWTVALAWTAVHVAGPAVAGLVVAAGTIPRAVVLLLGGVLADRLDARRLMTLVNGGRVVVLLVLAGAAISTDVTAGMLVGVAVGFGVCDALYEPAAATIGRQLVRPEQLPAYSGMSQTIGRIGSMAGAALGGVVVAGWGITGAAVVDAATFVVVAAYLVAVLRPRYPLERAAPEPVLRGIGRGFAHLRAEPRTRTLVVTLSGLNLAVSPALALGVALRAREAGWGAHALGALEALVGLGAAIGAVALVRARPSREAAAGFALLVVQGVAIAGLGFGPLAVTAAACLLIGVTAGAASALLSAVFAATIEAEYLGRMASIQRLGDDVLMPAAMAGFGALAGGVGPGAACAAFGGVMAAAMLAPLAQPTISRLSLSAQA